MNRFAQFAEQLVFVREYTVAILDTIPAADWFTMPAGVPTHVTWQVGHLAVAEARLVVERVGGRSVVEEGILPAEYLTLFGRQSTPDPDRNRHPPVEEIRRVFDRIHGTALEILRSTDDRELDTIVVGTPHRYCRTRGEYARWVSLHEMTHAGQIGLLRRMFNQSPIW